MSEKLGYWSAYKTMFNFLDKYWETNRLDDLALLLGSMNPTILGDDHPVDDKIFLDWLDIIKRDNILTEEVDMQDGFNCMILFLKEEQTYFRINLQQVIKELELSQERRDSQKGLWTLWIDSYYNSI